MPTDLDVYAPGGWVDDALVRPEVRDAYRRLVAQGWTDALRALHPDERIYTFWKYISGTPLPATPACASISSMRCAGRADPVSASASSIQTGA